MASLIYSTASFTEKLDELKLSSLQAEFSKHGWDTFAGYAVSCEYVPGQGGYEDFKQEVLTKLLGSETGGSQAAKIPMLKILFIQSHTLLHADLAR